MLFFDILFQNIIRLPQNYREKPHTQNADVSAENIVSRPIIVCHVFEIQCWILHHCSYRYGETLLLFIVRSMRHWLLNDMYLLFVFNKEKAKGREWVQFNLNEFGMSIGNQRFRFDRETLDNPPAIDFIIIDKPSATNQPISATKQPPTTN